MNSNNWDSQRNDQPQGKNPNEIGKTEPGKKVHAQHKIDIKESGLGRDQSQDPADEHIEDTISQIDKGTIDIQNENDNSTIKDSDNRDQGDSTEDWNAENNDSGRRK